MEGKQSGKHLGLGPEETEGTKSECDSIVPQWNRDPDCIDQPVVRSGLNYSILSSGETTKPVVRCSSMCSDIIDCKDISNQDLDEVFTDDGLFTVKLSPIRCLSKQPEYKQERQSNKVLHGMCDFEGNYCLLPGEPDQEIVASTPNLEELKKDNLASCANNELTCAGGIVDTAKVSLSFSKDNPSTVVLKASDLGFPGRFTHVNVSRMTDLNSSLEEEAAEDRGVDVLCLDEFTTFLESDIEGMELQTVDEWHTVLHASAENKTLKNVTISNECSDLEGKRQNSCEDFCLDLQEHTKEVAEFLLNETLNYEPWTCKKAKATCSEGGVSEHKHALDSTDRNVESLVRKQIADMVRQVTENNSMLSQQAGELTQSQEKSVKDDSPTDRIDVGRSLLESSSEGDDKPAVPQTNVSVGLEQTEINKAYNAQWGDTGMAESMSYLKAFPENEPSLPLDNREVSYSKTPVRKICLVNKEYNPLPKEASLNDTNQKNELSAMFSAAQELCFPFSSVAESGGGELPMHTVVCDEVVNQNCLTTEQDSQALSSETESVGFPEHVEPAQGMDISHPGVPLVENTTEIQHKSLSSGPMEQNELIGSENAENIFATHWSYVTPNMTVENVISTSSSSPIESREGTAVNEQALPDTLLPEINRKPATDVLPAEICMNPTEKSEDLPKVLSPSVYDEAELKYTSVLGTRTSNKANQSCPTTVIISKQVKLINGDKTQTLNPTLSAGMEQTPALPAENGQLAQCRDESDDSSERVANSLKSKSYVPESPKGGPDKKLVISWSASCSISADVPQQAVGKPTVQTKPKGLPASTVTLREAILSGESMPNRRDIMGYESWVFPEEDNKQMKEVKKRWKCDSLPSPDTNLTCANYWRKLRGKSTINECGILEGYYRASPLVDRIKSKESLSLSNARGLKRKRDGNDVFVDPSGGHSLDGKRMKYDKNVEKTVKQICSSLQDQKDKLERNFQNRLQELLNKRNENKSKICWKYEQKCEDLRWYQKEEMESLYLNCRHKADLHRPFIRLRQGHQSQLRRIRNEQCRELDQLEKTTKKKIADERKAFMEANDQLQQLICKEKRRTARGGISGPQVCYNMVSLVKAPCRSNKGKKSWVKVCLPADIGSAIIREDLIYDAFYVY